MRRTALIGAGLVGGAGAMGRLLRQQSATADRRVRPLVTPAPDPRELYGDPGDPPLCLAVLGDSSAQGVGVADFDDSLGGWLARELAATGRFVRVVCVAANGSRAQDLPAQVDRALLARPDLVAISTGANDVRHRSNPRRAARHLGTAVTRLRAAGAVVAVGTTPYLGILTQVDQPLRSIGHGLSLLLERQQLHAVRTAGGATVPLGRLLSPAFEADRGLFAADGFHPSARGYALIAQQMLPVLTATEPPPGVPSTA